MPKRELKKICKEAELVAQRYMVLSEEDRNLVMQAMARMKPVRDLATVKAANVPPAFAAVQTAPDRLTVANEDHANLRNGKWNLNSKRMRNMITANNLIMTSSGNNARLVEADHIFPFSRLGPGKFTFS